MMSVRPYPELIQAAFGTDDDNYGSFESFASDALSSQHVKGGSSAGRKQELMFAY